MLPLHPVLAYAAMAVIPLACAATIAYVVKPGWRWLLRWPVNVAWLLSFLATVASQWLGDALLDTMSQFSRASHNHTAMADLLALLVMPTMLLAWFGCFSLDSTSPLDSGWGSNEDREIKATKPLAWATVVLSVAILVVVGLTAFWGWYSVWRT